LLFPFVVFFLYILDYRLLLKCLNHNFPLYLLIFYQIIEFKDLTIYFKELYNQTK
jgi:hypothetical protein